MEPSIGRLWLTPENVNIQTGHLTQTKTPFLSGSGRGAFGRLPIEATKKPQPIAGRGHAAKQKTVKRMNVADESRQPCKCNKNFL
jgi:hypothetical protein